RLRLTGHFDRLKPKRSSLTAINFCEAHNCPLSDLIPRSRPTRRPERLRRPSTSTPIAPTQSTGGQGSKAFLQKVSTMVLRHGMRPSKRTDRIENILKEPGDNKVLRSLC